MYKKIFFYTHTDNYTFGEGKTHMGKSRVMWKIFAIPKLRALDSI